MPKSIIFIISQIKENYFFILEIKKLFRDKLLLFFTFYFLFILINSGVCFFME